MAEERKTVGERKTLTFNQSFNIENTDGLYYCGNPKEFLIDNKDRERRTTLTKRFTIQDLEEQVKYAWRDTYVYFLLNWDHDFKYLVAFFAWYVIFFVFGTVAAFITYYYWLNMLTYDCTAVLPAANSTDAITVLMIGDSLVRRPSAYFNLQGLLYDHLKPINATFINDGEDGETISAIAARLVPALELYNPQAVILYWDSDVSNIDEAMLTQQQVNDLHRNYRANLTWFINTTINYPSVEFMTVGGPELLGEGKLCLPMTKHSKTEMLQSYLAMNQNITAMMNVSYMDVRQQFLNNLPWYWPLGYYFLTVDGEHPNYRGAHIIAKMFADQLRPWIDARRGRSSSSSSVSVAQTTKGQKFLWSPTATNANTLQAAPKHFPSAKERAGMFGPTKKLRLRAQLPKTATDATATESLSEHQVSKEEEEAESMDV